MKIKCTDGVVRNFAPSREEWLDFSSNRKLSRGERPYKVFQGYSESACLECGELFGVHDTKVIKPNWREHICKEGKL